METLIEETKFIMKKYNIRANKSLGQNFLISEQVVNEIVESSKIDKEDLVIEIGPGLGTLTKYLLEKAGKVIGIELDKKMVEVYDLTNVVRPLIGRSSHAHSVFFKYDDWKKNVDQGKAAYLIDFPDTPIEKYSQGQKKYIELGEKNGDNTGYKCKIREKWYQIPSVWVPDAFFLRRNNLYPKFVLNCCDAVSTDTMHRIKFNNDIEPERIVLSYYNSISFAFTEICGRSYGGGVLEILPGEVGNVLVPILDCVPIEKVKEILYQVDEIVRNGENIEKALDLVDNSILGEYLHVNEETCSMARGIWKKMQHRRLKRG